MTKRKKKKNKAISSLMSAWSTFQKERKTKKGVGGFLQNLADKNRV